MPLAHLTGGQGPPDPKRGNSILGFQGVKPPEVTTFGRRKRMRTWCDTI